MLLTGPDPTLQLSCAKIHLKINSCARETFLGWWGNLSYWCPAHFYGKGIEPITKGTGKILRAGQLSYWVNTQKSRWKSDFPYQQNALAFCLNAREARSLRIMKANRLSLWPRRTGKNWGQGDCPIEKQSKVTVKSWFPLPEKHLGDRFESLRSPFAADSEGESI